MSKFTILKKSIFATLFTFVSSISFAADRYWVGGTGNWTDVGHWAVASGGAGGSGSVPTSTDNVFFDANSFNGAGQSVTITASASCLSMNWTGATNNPTFDVANSPINIYGSLVLISNMNLTATNSYYFKSTTTGNTITTAGKTIPHHFYFDGVGGSWTLLDNLTFGSNGIIYLQNGTLNTNGQTVTMVQFSSNNTNVRHLSMGSSVFNVSSGVAWDVQGANFTSDAGVSVVNVSDGTSPYFRGGTGSYNVVNFTNVLGNYSNLEGSGSIKEVNYYGTGRVYYSGTIQKVHFYKNGRLESNTAIDTVSCEPGITFAINSGYTLTTKKFFSNGFCNSPIIIEANPNTGSAAIVSTSAVIDFQYTHFKGISATGSASFTANNSIDLGNTTGITINNPPSQNLYWVGGSGSFNDAAHWSLTSGGAGGACVPTRVDNVVFDGASFNSGGQTVTINSNIECKSMDWTGVTNSPALTGTTTYTLSIYGSLTFVSNMTYNHAGEVHFKSTSSGNTITTAGKIFKRDVHFDGANADWTLTDDFSIVDAVSAVLHIDNGYLVTNDRTVTFSMLYSSGTNTCGVYLMNSTLNASLSTNIWNIGGPNFTVDAGTSTIIATTSTGNPNFNGRQGNSYYNVVFQNPNVTGSLNSGSSFNKVTFNGSGEINGTTNISVTKAVFGKSATLANTSSLTFDTLQIAGGYTTSLKNGVVHNINKLITPGVCSGLATIQSSTAGSQATINATSPLIVSYISLKDINRTGSSFTANSSQDLGNNTGITINAPASLNLYWVGGSGNWNDPAHWSLTQGGAGGACVPTQYDNVFFTTGSFTIGSKTVTMNVEGFCKSMNWTNAPFSPSFTGTADLNIYGSLTFTTTINFTWTGKTYFRATTTGNTITSAGKVFGNQVYFDGSGSWTLQDALNLPAHNLNLVKGTLNTNGKSVSVSNFYSTYTNTRGVVLGASLITINGNLWDVRGANFSINPGTSQIRFVNSSANSGLGANATDDYYDVIFQNATYRGGIASSPGTSFHNVTFYGEADITAYTSGMPQPTISNYYNKIEFKASVFNISEVHTVDSLIFASGSTSTLSRYGWPAVINVGSYLYLDGTPGDLTELYSSVPSTYYTINKSSCIVCCNYADIRNSIMGGGAQFYAANSIDGGNNTGWNFAACPSSTLTVGPISGNANTCINSTNYIYSIPAVSGADSYTWSVPAGATILSGQGTNTIYVSFGSTGGNVSVDVSACGTTGNATKAVTVNPLPTITNINTTPATCSNADGSATATVGGGTPGYYYRWSSGDTLATAPALAAGQYQLLVFDSYGCRAISNATIVASDGPSITLTSSTSPTCPNGTNGSLAISVTGGTTPYTILWSNGVSTTTNSGISAGPYEVVVTDANECSASLSTTLTQPNAFAVNFTISPSACAGSTGSAQANVTGGTGAYTYSWSPNAASQTTQTASALAAGVYTVTVTDANSCPYAAIATVPNAATTLTGSIGSVVAGDCGPNSAGTATMNASGGAGGYVYAWSNGATTADISGVAPGTYYCTVTDASLCSFSESVVIPSNVGSITQSICMVTVDTSTFTNQVIWEKTITNDIQSFKIYRESNITNVYTNIATVPFNNISEYTDPVANPAIHAWRYKITAVDSCGVETPYSPAHKTIHLAQNLGVGGEINLAWDQYEGFPYYSYYIWRHDPSTGWQPLDTLSTNYTTYTDFTPPSADSRYMIEVRPQSGCTSTLRLAGGQDINTVIVKSKSNIKNTRTVGIKSDVLNLNSKIKVYPNPASDLLNIELKMNNETATITIENMLGQVVYTMQTNKPSNSINTTNLNTGVYFVKVNTGKGIAVEKIIIE